jgi:hypothetical protein
VNIAFPAALLLLLLLPGIAAVQAFRGKFARKPDEPAGQAGITWVWLLALIFAPLIHLTLVDLLALFGAPTADVGLVLRLLASRDADTSSTNDGLQAIARMPWRIAGYFLLATIFGLAIGRALRWLVQSRRWDTKFAWLQFGSDWFYVFSGRLRPAAQAPDLVLVAVTVEHAGECFIYFGVLTKYAIDSTGDLQRLHLATAVRRNLRDDEKLSAQESPAADDRFYPIKGDELVLLCRDICTINVHYMSVDARTIQAPV